MSFTVDARRVRGSASKRTVSVSLVALFVALLAPPAAEAALKSAEKVFAEPESGKALVYFIREHKLQGMARTMFLYADDTFLGTVDDDGYTFAQVEPGRRMLWLNWTRVNHTAELEPGEVYYFLVYDHFRPLKADEARKRIAAVSHYCTPEPKEVATSADHLSNRGDRAAKRAEKETGEYSGSRGARNRHVAKWPTVDLAPYSVLVIEDFRVTDPKAEDRKRVDLLRSAPERIADYVKTNVDPGLFAEIRRGRLESPLEGALILRVEVTQYKPGSEVARMAVGLGAGSARLDFSARLIDGATNRELSSFSDERAYGWGGAMGAMGGIETIERNLAHELAVYLREGKQGTVTRVAGQSPVAGIDP